MNATNHWFGNILPRRQVELRLFCFPYAGGASSIYRGWAESLPAAVEIVPIELPGRGRRLQELGYTSMPALIQALGPVLHPYLDRPFALYGHSMGAMIAFELARFFRREYQREPQILFVSGRRAPQIPDPRPISYNMPEPELIKQLGRLQGTPKEILENAELMELLLPLIRADFQLIQTYSYSNDRPLHCPITVFGGTEDLEAPRSLLTGWEEQTDSRFTLHMLPGDHFFLKGSQPLLLRLLARQLSESPFSYYAHIGV